MEQQGAACGAGWVQGAWVQELPSCFDNWFFLFTTPPGAFIWVYGGLLPLAPALQSIWAPCWRQGQWGGWLKTPGAAMNLPILILTILEVLIRSRCDCANAVRGSQLSARESLAKGQQVWAKMWGALSFCGQSARTSTSALFHCGACIGAHILHWSRSSATGANNVYCAALGHFILQAWQPGTEHQM